MSILNLLLFLISLAADEYQSDNSGKLSVTIENIKEAEGQLIIALFDSKETYLEEDFRSQTVEVKGKSQEVVFDELPPGYYSVSIIYDKNKNGELDKNFFGLPREGFGFSRKSLGTFGPPSYDETKIRTNNDNVEISIQLKYLL